MTVRRKSNKDKVGDTVETDDNGNYTIKGSETKITKDKLGEYYVEFEYDGDYIISNYDKDEKGSKGYGYTYKSRTAWSYRDTEDESKYGLTSEDNYKNMNLGLRPASGSTEILTKDVAYVKAEIKGKQYVYYYGVTNERDEDGGLKSVDVGNKDYYNRIYASDIMYSKEENVTDGLKVYITYKIEMINTTETKNSDEQEIGLRLESIIDYYKSDDYILSKEEDRDILPISNDYWEEGDDGTAELNTEVRDDIYLKRYGTVGDSKNLYITFELTDSAINRILTEGTFTTENRVTMEGCHEYQFNEGDDNEENWVDYERVAKKEADAPGMRFSILENESVDIIAEREIKGKVFEDKVLTKDEATGSYKDLIAKGAILGNGKYDTNIDNLIENVKVELLDEAGNNVNYYSNKDEDGNTLYDEDGKIVWHNKGPIVNYTNSLGEYTLTGMPPRRL